MRSASLKCFFNRTQTIIEIHLWHVVRLDSHTCLSPIAVVQRGVRGSCLLSKMPVLRRWDSDERSGGGALGLERFDASDGSAESILGCVT